LYFNYSNRVENNNLFQLAESNATVVTLLEADIDTSGKYRCEVSAEAPSFHTESDFRELTVVGK
jgi:hypothetical protein